MFNLQQEVAIFLAVRERQKAEREQGLVQIEESKPGRRPSLRWLRAVSRVRFARQPARQERRQAKSDPAL